MKRLIAIVALATLAGGCAVVLSDEPLGTVARIDPGQWEVVWTRIDDPVPMRVRVVDAANGELSVLQRTTTALEVPAP